MNLASRQFRKGIEGRVCNNGSRHYIFMRGAPVMEPAVKNYSRRGAGGSPNARVVIHSGTDEGDAAATKARPAARLLASTATRRSWSPPAPTLGSVACAPLSTPSKADDSISLAPNHQARSRSTCSSPSGFALPPAPAPPEAWIRIRSNNRASTSKLPSVPDEYFLTLHNVVFK